MYVLPIWKIIRGQEKSGREVKEKEREADQFYDLIYFPYWVAYFGSKCNLCRCFQAFDPVLVALVTEE